MYSFDVFDTLIARKTATPKGIFSLIQHKLMTCLEYQAISRYIAANFFELRFHAEELARKNNEFNGIEEISLDEIYIVMALTGCLSPEERRVLCELERITELENVVGIDENIEKVKSLISQGEEVILLSDMYLDKVIIREMLVKADPIFREIPLYISSELKKRKTSGNLYRMVKDKLVIDYDNWIHFGDNSYQDIEVPFKLGITVQQYHPEPLIVFEEKLLKDYESNAFLQLMIGAAKNARRREGLTSDAEKIGASLSGPILYSYADWILNECIEKGTKRLYFIARDGYLIKKIVDIMIEYQNIDIDTFYIYGSRKAWRIPSLSREEFNLYQIIQWSNVHKIKTIEDLADVLMIPVEELLPFLPQGCHNKSIKVTSQTVEYLVKKLERDTEFIEYCLAKHAPKREAAKRYLWQEIDFSDDSFAFVDISGGGLTQGCLKKLLAGVYNKPIRTYFFKIDRVNLMNGCINEVFIPSFLKNSLVLEMVSRAPHGQTIGYRMDHGKTVAITEDLEVEAILQHGFLEYQRGVECYTRQMAEQHLKQKEMMSSVDVIIKYINYIAEEPDNITLTFFASFPSSETGREKQLLEFAPKLTREDIDNIYLRRTTEYLEDYYKGSYYEYSLIRCSKKDMDYINQCKREYHSSRGKSFRQDKICSERDMIEKYGSAGRFPCEILEKNVVLYGAGKFGQGLYKKITGSGTSKVVQWVDRDFVRYNETGLNLVEAPAVIGLKAYDQLVIAVAGKELAQAIRQELSELKVPEEKMVWIDTNPYLQNYIN